MNDYKIVQFDVWCPQCKHWKTAEDEEPCHDCLNAPVNLDSKRPTRFELSRKAKPIKPPHKPKEK